MPKVSWSSDVQQRVRRLLEELLSYVLDYRNDLSLEYRWEHEESDRPKLIVETQRRFLVELAQFEIQSHFYEAIKRLEDLKIFEDRRFHTRGKDYWHFALRLWGKDKQKNLREFDTEWEQKRPQKSKQLENKKPLPQKSKVSPLRYHNIPESGVIEFVGRSDELERLYQQFQQTDRIAISAIAGMGGVGKTELAIQYARQHLENLEKKNCSGGVCWLLARGSDVGAKVVQFAKSHFPNFTIPEGLTPQVQVEFCWQNWWQGDVLVVFDDVTDYNQIKFYLPPKSSQFKVLITTREKLQPPIVRLDLDVLKPQAALELLASLVKTRPERMQQKADIAAQLCKWLGYLPLGLELVGRYLDQEPDLSFSEMLQRLEKRRIRHPALTDPKPEMTDQLGVAAAFELSWERLDSDAQELGCLLSLFTVAPIPWSLVENIAGEQCLLGIFIDGFMQVTREDLQETPEALSENLLEAFKENLEKARAVLVRGHLLQRTGQGTYRLHQLIREFLREKLKLSPQADGFRQLFVAAMLTVAKQISNSLTRDQILVVVPAIPHLEEVARGMVEYLPDEDFGWAFIGLVSFYNGQGLYHIAENWCHQFLTVANARLGSDHIGVIGVKTQLGLIYKLQGRYNEAESIYVQALKQSQSLLIDNHPLIATIQNQLALVCSLQGRFSEAEILFMQSLTSSKIIPENADYDLLGSFNNLATLYISQGRYREAETILLKALELTKSHNAQDSIIIIAILNNLGNIYEIQGIYAKAESKFVEALEVGKRLLGENHPDIATALNNLALVYKSQGRYREAEQLYLQALKILRRSLGDGYPGLATTLDNLGRLYSIQKRYEEAEQLLQEALQLKKRLLGDKHPDVATTLNNLALLFVEQGNYGKAEPLFIQSLEIKKHLLGENHPEFAATLNNLGMVYFNQGRYNQAEQLYLKALQIRRLTLGNEHPSVADSLHNLAELCLINRRFVEAKALWKQALEVSTLVLGNDHPDTILYRQNLHQNLPLIRTMPPEMIEELLKRYRSRSETETASSRKHKNPLAEYKQIGEHNRDH